MCGVNSCPHHIVPTTICKSYFFLTLHHSLQADHQLADQAIAEAVLGRARGNLPVYPVQRRRLSVEKSLTGLVLHGASSTIPEGKGGPIKTLAYSEAGFVRGIGQSGKQRKTSLSWSYVR